MLENWRVFSFSSKVEVHRTGKFPSGRTGLIEARYRPDLTLSSIVSYRGLFSELGVEILVLGVYENPLLLREVHTPGGTIRNALRPKGRKSSHYA